jgi:hypothetical protein
MDGKRWKDRMVDRDRFFLEEELPSFHRKEITQLAASISSGSIDKTVLDTKRK